MSSTASLKVVCVSDTHEQHRSLMIPQADLLIHAGDLTMMGKPQPIREFNHWCGELVESGNVKSVIGIAGNHDFLFEQNPKQAESLMTHVTYLNDSGVEFEGWRIYGTPWQPWFYDWAFNLRSEDELKRKFDRIPENTDILICHSPPRGILDANLSGHLCGSSALLEAILRVKPRLVVFGHIHEAYGILEKDGIVFVNASSCSVDYRKLNIPVGVILQK